jgi:transglutaminase-like putative cysteine protease
MLLRIYHETTYHYPTPVSDSYMEARLRPWSDADQGCADYSLATTPSARLHQCRTPFAWVDFFNILAPHDRLRLVSEATVIAMPRNPFERLGLREGDWPTLADDDWRGRFWEYLQPAPEPEVADAACRMAAELRRDAGEGVAHFLVALNHHIHQSFEYDPRATSVTTPLAEVLAQRRGVCQDFSHLMLAVTRSAGVPARYVSGYLHVEDPAKGHGAMHAWVEAYVPEAGWIGFDPTHGLLADHNYIKVGVGRAYSDVPPTRGVYRGPQEQSLEVEVRVTAAPEGTTGGPGTSRSTAPFRESGLMRAMARPW